MLEVTREELNLLPRWARVAFAARCAERISGLFRYYWKDAPDEHTIGIDQSVERGATSARIACPVVPLNAAANAGFAAILATDAAGADDVAFAIDEALREATISSNGVSEITSKIDLPFPKFIAAHEQAHVMSWWPMSMNFDAEELCPTSRFVRAAILVECDERVRSAQRYDYLMLKRLSEIHGWNDDSPVDPDLCGPIWPEGVPEKWPLKDSDTKKKPEKADYLDLTFDLPPDVDDETAQQLIRELYEKLNDHYVAHGGSGLVLDNYQAFEPQTAEVLS